MLWFSTFMYDHYSLVIIDYSLLKLFYMSIQYVIQGHMHRLYHKLCIRLELSTLRCTSETVVHKVLQLIHLLVH